MLTEFFANWTRFTVKQTLVPNIANNDACFWHGVWEWGGRFVNLFILLPQCQTLQTFHTFLTKWTEKAQHKFVSVQLHKDFWSQWNRLKVFALDSHPNQSCLVSHKPLCENSGCFLSFFFFNSAPLTSRSWQQWSSNRGPSCSFTFFSG